MSHPINPSVDAHFTHLRGVYEETVRSIQAANRDRENEGRELLAQIQNSQASVEELERTVTSLTQDLERLHVARNRSAAEAVALTQILKRKEGLKSNVYQELNNPGTTNPSRSLMSPKTSFGSQAMDPRNTAYSSPRVTYEESVATSGGKSRSGGRDFLIQARQRLSDSEFQTLKTALSKRRELQITEAELFADAQRVFGPRKDMYAQFVDIVRRSASQ